MSKTQSGPFFPQSGNSLMPSYVPVSVAEYASISLNMAKCPWKWLNKLSWLCQVSEYACSSYMFDRLLKMFPFLKTGFWIWHGCIYKVYPDFRIYLIMAPYASITTEYAQICFNVPQYFWIWLNIPKCPWIYEYPWICLNKLFWFFHVSEYAEI